MDIFVPYEGMKLNHLVPGERFNFGYIIYDADSANGWDSTLCWGGWASNLRNPFALARMEPLVGK